MSGSADSAAAGQDPLAPATRRAHPQEGGKLDSRERSPSSGVPRRNVASSGGIVVCEQIVAAALLPNLFGTLRKVRPRAARVPLEQ